MGAIEPVGITKASATKARNRNAKINATARLSTVSRIQADELVEVFSIFLDMSPLDSSGAAAFAFVDTFTPEKSKDSSELCSDGLMEGFSFTGRFIERP